MKTKNLFSWSIIPIGIVALFCACHKEHCVNNQNTSTTNQENPELDNSYQRAKLYNDSLEMCHNGTIANHDSLMEQYYDNQYHHYDSLMVQHHNNCHGSSNNGSGSMMGGSGGMMGSENTMGGNNGNMSCGCGTEMHSNLDSLHQNHLQYHPI